MGIKCYLRATKKGPQGRWSGWSAWSMCSHTCGTGIKIRTRKCWTGKGLCEGPAIISLDCETGKECPKKISSSIAKTPIGLGKNCGPHPEVSQRRFWWWKKIQHSNFRVVVMVSVSNFFPEQIIANVMMMQSKMKTEHARQIQVRRQRLGFSVKWPWQEYEFKCGK